MNTERRRELEQLMARAAAGDPTAWVGLIGAFRPELAGVLRRLAAERGWYPEPHELDGLVTQAAILLADLAGGWRPDGALPWRWATGRLQALVRLEAPGRSASIDALTAPQREQVVELAAERHRAGPVPADTDGDVLALERLARYHPEAALVRCALAEAAAPTDVALFLAYRSQQTAGDPSPAATVGPAHGLNAAAVRQRVRRIQQRLERVVAGDPRYAPLAGRPLFPGRAAAAAPPRAA